MKVIDKLLVRHTSRFLELVFTGEHKTTIANNVHVLKAAVQSGIIVDLKESDIDDAEPWRVTEGDLADIALAVSDAVGASLKPPDPN